MMRLVTAGLAYFAWVFLAGFLFGLVRVPFLEPSLGVRVAELIEMPLMFMVIILAARFMVSRWRIKTYADAGMVGLIAWLALNSVEFGLAFIVQKLTPVQFILSKDPVSGSLYFIVVVLCALWPMIIVRHNKSQSS